MAPVASPRSVVLSHGMGVALGVLCLMGAGIIWPQSALLDPTTINWHRVVVIALSTAALAVLMVVFGCVHPPAAATAMIAALGYFTHPLQIIGLMGAVILLVLEALFFIRILRAHPISPMEIRPSPHKEPQGSFRRPGKTGKFLGGSGHSNIQEG